MRSHSRNSVFGRGSGHRRPRTPLTCTGRGLTALGAHSPTHLRGGLHPVLDTAPQSIGATAVGGVGRRAECRARRELVAQVDGLIFGGGGEVHRGHGAVAIHLGEGGVALRAARGGWVQGGGAIAAATLRGGVIWNKRPGGEAPPQRPRSPQAPRGIVAMAATGNTCPVLFSPASLGRR